MTSTILTWTAPVAALAALVGLWRSSNESTRRGWRFTAVVTALGATAMMALFALPGEAALASLVTSAPRLASVLFGSGLWIAVSALLIDEYRRPRLSRRLADGSLWSEIARELTSDDSLDTMLLNIAGVFRRDANGACAHVFKISAARHAAYRTGTVYSEQRFSGDHSTEHARLLAELAWWGAHEHQMAMVDGAGGTPILALPIGDGVKTYAMIMIENPDQMPSTDWMPMAALVGRNIADWSEITEYSDSGRIAKRMTERMPRLLHESRIEDVLGIVHEAMLESVDYDYISVSSLGASQAHEDRATMLPGSQRVIESRHRWPVAGAALHRVMSTARAVITPDLDMAGDDDESDTVPWERRLGMRSRLIVPICDGEKVLGTITLAHRRYARFSEYEMELTATVAAFLAPWMRQLVASRQANRTERALTFLRKLESSIFATLDDKAIASDASTVLDATGMRIYRLDDENQTLVEVASSGRLPVGESPRQLSLSSLPWHRLALASRRTQTIDQANPEAVMGTSEAGLAMDARMKTGCLVPIVADGRALGVIDVVERRHPDRNRIDSGSRLILETLASMLAQRWTESGTCPNADDSAALTDRLKAWSRQVVNPLTSIIGSVELIRHREAQLSPELIKYLTTIERSATRIHESMVTILAEAAATANDQPLPSTRERFTLTRPTERAGTDTTNFARPASLVEAAMRFTDVSPTAPGVIVSTANTPTLLG